MPVYSYKTIDQLNTSLDNLAGNMFAKTPLVLTGDEFLEAFVSPDHVPMLREVQDICKPGTGTLINTSLETADGECLTIRVEFNWQMPVIMPQYVRHGIQPTCPQGLRDKITAWVEERASFGRAFGDVKDALTFLNDNCGDARAMAVMLPCFATIMGGISTDGESSIVKRARKLTNVTSFGSLPRLPVQVKRRIAEAAAVVNASTLMSDAPYPVTKRYDATFRVDGIERNTRTNIFYFDNEPVVATASFI